MFLQPKTFEEPETLVCRATGRRLDIFRCMSRFVDANALNQKDRPCFKCIQGQDLRMGYSKS